MSQRKELLRQRVIQDIDLCREVDDEELYETIDRILMEDSKEDYVSVTEKLRMRKDIFNSIRRFDILQELIEDPTITEIMVNGPKNIFIEQNGKISPCDRHFESAQKLEDVVQQMVKVNKNIGYFLNLISVLVIGELMVICISFTVFKLIRNNALCRKNILYKYHCFARISYMSLLY